MGFIFEKWQTYTGDEVSPNCNTPCIKKRLNKFYKEEFSLLQDICNEIEIFEKATNSIQLAMEFK